MSIVGVEVGVEVYSGRDGEININSKGVQFLSVFSPALYLVLQTFNYLHKTPSLRAL